MDYITYSKRLDYLLDIIDKGKLYSPKQITENFNCCDKTARNMINTLREKGYCIEYCKLSKKYLHKKIRR